MTASALALAERAQYLGQHYSILYPMIALEAAARRVVRRPPPAMDEEAVALVRRRFDALLARDLENVRAGYYPKELLFQLPVRQYLKALPALVADAPRILRRLRAHDWKDLPSRVDLERYPPYYRRTFHWQSDGYLSRRSAELYDVGVELLFRGMADVMRRQVIPPISRHLAALGKAPRDVRLADVACGTGRTLSQIHRAHPEIRLAGVDLSPFYVQAAREKLAHVPDVSLCVENAEHLPFKDAWFDVVVSVYLFHELPRNARRRVLEEAYRVLAPGGLLVVEDSAQLSESPELATVLAAFSHEFHEPFYDDYSRDDLGALLAEIGFEVVSAEPHLVAKVVVARRPARDARAAGRSSGGRRARTPRAAPGRRLPRASKRSAEGA